MSWSEFALPIKFAKRIAGPLANIISNSRIQIVDALGEALVYIFVSTKRNDGLSRNREDFSVLVCVVS